MSWAVCSLEGNKKTKKIPVRTYKIGLIQRNPGNCLIHSRKKNFERPPRELQCVDRDQTSTRGSGRPSCVEVVLWVWLKVLVRRDKFENRRKFHKYAYTYIRRIAAQNWHQNGVWTGQRTASPNSGLRLSRSSVLHLPQKKIKNRRFFAPIYEWKRLFYFCLFLVYIYDILYDIS